MSQLRRPVFVGISDIMDGFESLSKQGDLVFAVWLSDRDIAFQCAIDDQAVQKDILQYNLEALEKSGNTDLMYLKMYPANAATNGFIDAKARPISVTPIQVCEFKGITGPIAASDIVARPTGMSYEAWEMLKSLKDLPATIEAKINDAVTARLAELMPEEPEDDGLTKTLNAINGLASNPAIMSFLGQTLGYLTRMVPVAPSRIGMVEPLMTQQEINPGQTIAKERIAFNEDMMNEALDRLSYHCDLGTDLAKLAEIAENNPAYFKTLLGILRNS